MRKRYGCKTAGDEDTEGVRLERGYRYWRHRKRGLAGSLRPTLGESWNVAEHVGPRVQSSPIAILQRKPEVSIGVLSSKRILAVQLVVSSEFPVGRGNKPRHEEDSYYPKSHSFEVEPRQPVPVWTGQVQFASDDL